ncbi:MAG: hypothetical protein ACLR4Z_01685 [Butyricicoccaceae bacterium]
MHRRRGRRADARPDRHPLRTSVCTRTVWASRARTATRIPTPATPHLRAIDGVNPMDRSLPRGA